MKVEARLHPAGTGRVFAQVELTIEGVGTCRLTYDEKAFRAFGVVPSETTQDLLLAGAIVYALDRKVERTHAQDAWTRVFNVTLPVAEPDRWRHAQATLERCLSFLSGDQWSFSFVNRTAELYPLESSPNVSNNTAVSLYSGGIDSLVGIIDYLEEQPDHNLILTGHHDPRIGGPLGDQRAVLKVLNQHYPGRLYPFLAGIGATSGNDTTLRSRSFLFICLGVYAAAVLRENALLLVPENGTIALNMPLTPSRRGSCSTRTAHPYYLELLQDLLGELELSTQLINPLVSKTKGEVVATCKNQYVLHEALAFAMSCAKRGHTSSWVRRSANACGRCMPCIYRRAALHRIGLDTETYGNDICAGEVDPESELESANDFRALLGFLRGDPDRVEVARLLLANGRLDTGKLDDYAQLVLDTMDEVRGLLRDKAPLRVRTLAGLT